MFAFLALSVGMQAQVTVNEIQGAITVDDVEIEPGGTATAIVKLAKKPRTGCRGVQFDLYLPDKIRIDTYMATEEVWSDEEDDWVEVEVEKLNIKLSSEQPAVYQVQASFPYDDDLQHLRVIVTSISETQLNNRKDLVEIGLKAADDYYGTHQATVAGDPKTSKINISGKDGNDTWVQDPFDFNIKTPLVFDEMEDYAIGDFAPAQEMTVTMKRSIGANKWNTICLPFSMTNDQMTAVFGENVKLAEFSGCEKTVNGENVHLSLSFTSITIPEITANTPYLIKSENAITYEDGFTLKVDFTELENEPAVTKDECTFHGNYAVENNLDKALYISNETFKVAIGATRVKSFRGYFTHPALEESNANVSIFVDDEPTGIRGISTDQDNNDIYDISGRKVNSDKATLQKGVYIINGKKETVH